MGTGFDLDITVHRGAGAYICGEETGLLSSLEGGRGYPKIKPPFPAVEGLFKCPTVINNVETLANLPHILNHGIDWYKGMGTEASPGPKLFGVSGHVNRPGLIEVPFGLTLNQIIDGYCGGVWKDKKLKGVIPGGSSAPVFTPKECDCVLCFDAVRDAGSMLGSGGVIVMDEDTCMVNALWNLLRFYEHESCGQCTPCREGTGWIQKIVARIEHGQGRPEDLELLDDVSRQMCGRTICVLADAAAMPCQSFISKFRDEFMYHIEHGKCLVGSHEEVSV
jgi:NADH-quinone oxidoreductase subunit F